MDVRQHLVGGRERVVEGRPESVGDRAQFVEQWWAGLPRYDRHLARAFARTRQALPQELYDQLVQANVVVGAPRHGGRPAMPNDVRSYVLSHAA